MALRAIGEAHGVLSLTDPGCSSIMGQMFGYTTVVAHDLITSLDGVLQWVVVLVLVKG